ncbi:hypothetical protein SUBVAR_06683 [Subdoligranulum variabile DSM 15176]|uniref:Uncharacterized protein n=1 Tax=Subdoligranulum variabile DSM 15176 TaxID=411471 RepID=D1PQL4_9FIRM|nr:hypothetical protein SUBVAR_06683 [Subdoligranulum variabile DSM 15176]
MRIVIAGKNAWLYTETNESADITARDVMRQHFLNFVRNRPQQEASL